MENIEVNHSKDISLIAHTSDNTNVQKALKDFNMITSLSKDIKNFNILNRIEHLEMCVLNLLKTEVCL